MCTSVHACIHPEHYLHNILKSVTYRFHPSYSTDAFCDLKLKIYRSQSKICLRARGIQYLSSCIEFINDRGNWGFDSDSYKQ